MRWKFGRGVKREWVQGPGGLLGVCVGTYFTVRFAQVVIGPIVPVLKTDLGITAGTVGILLTLMWMAYAIMQIPSGMLSDHFGPTQVVLAAILITGIATLVLSLAPTPVIFGFAVLALGAGAGTYYNPATALLASTFDQVGGAVGTHRIGGQVAGVIAPIVAAAISDRLGWRVAVAFAGIVTIVMSAAFTLWRSASAVRLAGTTARTSLSVRSALSILNRRHTRETTLMMTAVEFVGLSAMAFLPAFLMVHHGLSFTTANLLFAAFFAMSAIFQPLSGWGSDRFGRDVMLLILAAMGILGYTGLVITDSLWVVPAVLLTGIAMSATPVVQSRMIDGLPASVRATGFGVFRTIYLLIGATGSTAVGLTADVASWGLAFSGLAMVWGAVLVLTSFRLVRP